MDYKKQAQENGWAEFGDSEDASPLVVVHDNQTVYFAGPDAWREAVEYDKANQTVYFALMDSGKLVHLGKHNDFESANDAAEEIGTETDENVIWVQNADAAKQWQSVLNNNL